MNSGGSIVKLKQPASRATASGRSLLAIASLVTFALWFVPYSNYVLYPIRLFVTFIHESGHAIAATLSGGDVQQIRIFMDGSGVTYTHDSFFWRWLVLSGGYLGAATFGAVLLQVGRINRANAGRAALYAASGYMAVITLLWARPLQTTMFTFCVGICLAFGLWVMVRVLTPKAAAFMASFLAVQCCLDALTDLNVLFNLTSTGHADNDAGFMQSAYGLPATLCAVVWAVAALVILGLALRSYLRATGPRTVGRLP